MKFLNIFRKKEKSAQEPPQTESDALASVTYSIDKEGEIYVDINLEDFEGKPLNSLASLVSMISTVKCQLVTIEMIKNGFFEEGKVAEYLTFAAQVAANTEEYLEVLKTDNQDEPYIKPSDMM